MMTDRHDVLVQHDVEVPTVVVYGRPVDYLEVPGADHVWRGAASVSDSVAASLEFVEKKSSTLTR